MSSPELLCQFQQIFTHTILVFGKGNSFSEEDIMSTKRKHITSMKIIIFQSLVPKITLSVCL